MVDPFGHVLALLAARLAEAGATAYVTGGALRDLILGRTPRDVDLLIEAGDSVGEAAALRALRDLSGMEPVIFDRRPPATHRVIVGGIIVDASFLAPGRIEEALHRRDFTINAMAAPLGNVAQAPDVQAGAGEAAPAPTRQALAPHILDPVGGLPDIAARRLRAASPGALDEDPLRMLRAARLETTLAGFSIDAELAEAIRRAASRIREPAAERIHAEIEIILGTPRAGVAFRRMDALGLLSPILPDLEPLRGLKQPARHHDYDAFEHTLRALEAADALSGGCEAAGLGVLDGDDPIILKWAALLHDVGKAATATVDDQGTPHFYGHETVSAALAEEALRRLRAPQRIAAPVVSLIEMHLRLGALAAASATDRPIRRLVRAAGDLLPMLALLSIADRRASGGESAAAREAALLDTVRRALALRDDMAALVGTPPLLDGREVMEILALRPGPRVGSILRWLDRLRADGRIATRDDAVALLKSLPPPRIVD